MLPGFEGSATDAAVLRKALENGLSLPQSDYYLADGGYTKKNRLVLVPYQRTRYHLREIADAANARTQNKEELFNLRHARLQNVVERLIGIMKQRWRNLRDGPETGFSVQMQSLFVYALSSIRDFALDAGQTVDEDVTLPHSEPNGLEQDDAQDDIDSTATTGVDGQSLE